MPSRISKFDASGTILADFPLPFDAVEEAAPGGAGGRAAKTPARGRRAADADSSDEEDSDGGPQMPDSSDDEGGDEVRRARRPACLDACMPSAGRSRPGPGLLLALDPPSPPAARHPPTAHLPPPAMQERTPARVPVTASRRLPDRAARSARKPVVEAPSSSDEDEESEEEAESEGEGEEEEDGVAPLGENASPAVRRPSKARRQSSDSVSALRQALQENRIS